MPDKTTCSDVNVPIDFDPPGIVREVVMAYLAKLSAVEHTFDQLHAYAD